MDKHVFDIERLPFYIEGEKHALKLVLRDAPRTWTREEYRNVRRWLRMSRNVIERSMDWDGIGRVFVDSLTYGTGVFSDRGHISWRMING